MIITKLQGGLGNQLFQWAVTRSISYDLNVDYYFDLTYFKSNIKKSVTKREFELKYFDKIYVNELNGLNNLKHIKDDYKIKNIQDNSYLDGYWQSEKYFKHNDKIIKNDLAINNNLKRYIYNKYKFLNYNTISIHVRRGDYLKLSKKHPPQSKVYYENAYDYIPNHTNMNVVILSDDINWCKDNFKFSNMYFIENESNIIDLYIMSLSNHNIISNSTFSWWGSWLNNNKDKIVIAPNKWFGDNFNHNADNIICENWIMI